MLLIIISIYNKTKQVMLMLNLALLAPFCFSQNLIIDPIFNDEIIHHGSGMNSGCSCAGHSANGPFRGFFHWTGTGGFFHKCHLQGTHHPPPLITGSILLAPGNGHMPAPKRGKGYSGLNAALEYYTLGANTSSFNLVQELSQPLDSGETYILELFYRSMPFAGFSNKSIRIGFSTNPNYFTQDTIDFHSFHFDDFPSRDEWRHFQVSFVAKSSNYHWIIFDSYVSQFSDFLKFNVIRPLPIPPNGVTLTTCVSMIEKNSSTLLDDIHLYKASDTIFHINLGNDTILCPGENIEISAEPIDFVLEDTIITYNWSTGHTSPTIIVREAGVYTVEVTINHRFKAYDTIVVEYDYPPRWRLPWGGQHIICNEDFLPSTVLGPSAIEGAIYQWSTGQTTREIEVNDTGFYELRVITPCFDETQGFRAIAQNCKKPSIFIPSAFTPQGRNPLWIIGGIPPNTRVEVYSRWGQRIFYSEDYLHNWWDGTINGQPVPPGSYTYRIVAPFEGQDPVDKTGTVTIVR
jgi:gliding motility-associated-like protein